MIQKTLTFQGLSRLFFTESEFSLPDGWTKLTMDCSMVSPGTELFCIREGKTCMPGYIMTGHTDDGKHWFVFPSMQESSGAHCNLRGLSPESLLLPLPEDFPLELAGFLRFISIGMHPFNNVGILPDRVAVIGLGPVGNLAAQTAHLFGCSVVGVDPSESRRELARKCGIEAVVPPLEFEALEREFELVIDTVSASSTLKASARALKDNGSCSMVGIVKPGSLPASELCTEIWNRNLLFRSGWEMKNPLSLTERNLKRGMRRILDGSYVLRPLLTEIVKPELSEIARIYRSLAEQPDKYFCCAIDWRA